MPTRDTMIARREAAAAIVAAESVAANAETALSRALRPTKPGAVGVQMLRREHVRAQLALVEAYRLAVPHWPASSVTHLTMERAWRAVYRYLHAKYESIVEDLEREAREASAPVEPGSAVGA